MGNIYLVPDTMTTKTTDTTTPGMLEATPAETPDATAPGMPDATPQAMPKAKSKRRAKAIRGRPRKRFEGEPKHMIYLPTSVNAFLTYKVMEAKHYGITMTKTRLIEISMQKAFGKKFILFAKALDLRRRKGSELNLETILSAGAPHLLKRERTEPAA
ncbi:MAG: hypothetical protein LBT40_04100 [Deltaproteobacteria bacterium]|jgi:hypothetical protein|nr:hypothetical protein [Deltaproteobacteria bacterium]